ncbi:hypothetical protein B0H15DRAFT_950998 [Mycena belliarum]|uniref:Uncharacterized protein n=1 Tax=Mycena belliarum TaxID=1033014 RepID=A0AAD6U4C6_9AGAR|nr:hypothetical protein B0H15DRAFT_950998 [Mycena belliae]
MSLPIYTGQTTPTPAPTLTRYVVESSDVLEETLKVNVVLEGSEKVIWFKERFLEDDEIIDHVVHNESRRICWTIHRPRNGWYIRIRAPSFPPGAFIPLIPPLPDAPHPPGALLFSSRTNIPPAPDTETRVSMSNVHSYPPTPPATVVVHPPTPSSVAARLEQVQGRQRHQPPPTQVTQFVLAPYTSEVLKPAEMSYFQRALSVIKSHSASPSYSFTLAPVLSSTPPPAYPATPVASPMDSTASLAAQPVSPPLLAFHDRTPVMMVRSITGLIEIDSAEERALGVESSFWIAVALCYLNFLQEKESYLAALSD